VIWCQADAPWEVLSQKAITVLVGAALHPAVDDIPPMRMV